MASPSLRQELDYYIEHHAELVAAHRGKCVVIKNRAVIGVFDTLLDAVTETAKKEPLGTFLVQKVEPGVENYTQSFHSRVAFA